MSVSEFEITSQNWPIRKRAEIKTPDFKEGKKWNPFIPEKLFAHIYRWRLIQRGKKIPAPVLVTVDPTNLCDFDCRFCNAKAVRKRGGSLSRKLLMDLADFLARWGGFNPEWPYGVEAVSVAGGGEPLLNPHTGEFIERVTQNGIQAGLITNGVLLDKYKDAISKCTWVSVSMDAGSSDIHHVLKRTPSILTFNKIIEGIYNLVEYSRSHKETLGSSLPAYGVTYKYLLHPENIGEVYQATKLAKDLGCKNICFRPASTPIGGKEISFSQSDLDVYHEQMREAMELDDENFNVYAYTWKVGPRFEKANCFEKCWAVFMNAQFSPGPENDTYSLGLCCDRRGEAKLKLVSISDTVEQINQMWGSEYHWDIHDSINQKTECPRCTYNLHNQIYEQVIQNDCLTYRMI